MDYKVLDKLLENRVLPITATNQDGENVIVEHGANEEMGLFYRLTVAQRNGWCRINTYYEDGSYEEEYK